MGNYVLSLTAVAIMAGILLSFCGDGTVKQMLRLVCGILLTLTALQPLAGWKLPDLETEYTAFQTMGDDYADMGAEMAAIERSGRISKALEAYILDKAMSLDAPLSVTVQVTSDGQPSSISLTGTWTREQQLALQSIITKDLGIPGEDQTWITKREEAASPTSSKNTGGQQWLP